MPNTLAHIGVQLPLTRSIFKKMDPRWISLGLLIPDIPWILQRLIEPINFSESAIELRAYVVVMSTPLFCIILSAAIAFCLKKSRLIFITLILQIALHLILDGLQVKTGRGIPVFAPFNWSSFHYPLFSMDGWFTNLLTFTGVASILLLATGKLKYPDSIKFHLQYKRFKSYLPLVLFASYLIVPLFLKEAVIQSNVHDLAVWRGDRERAGTTVTFDRARYQPGDSPQLGFISDDLTGSPIPIIGIKMDQPGLISATATFVDDDTLQTNDYTIHPQGRRFWYSVVGLIGILVIWITPFFTPKREL